MIKNYITTLFRNFSRQKIYTFLNVSGLAFGLAVFIIIVLYIQFEFSFDRFHANADRIYQVSKIQTRGGGFMGSTRYGVTPAPLAAALREEFPEVESATILYSWPGTLIRNKQKIFTEYGCFADNFMFEIFSFPLVKGNEKTALENPFSVVISEKMATKYFGNSDPIGQILNFNNENDFLITGIMKNIPDNSYIKADFFASFKSLRVLQGNSIDEWYSSSYQTFLLLRKGADHTELEKKYPAFIEKIYQGQSNWTAETADIYYHQKLTDIHLKCDSIFNYGPVSDIKYIRIFSVIAFFILLIACVNYMNLSTARATKRAREVGIRKVVGARRIQLVSQFLGESLMLTFLSLFAAVGIAYLLLPIFNRLMERELAFHFLENPGFILMLLGIGIVVGLVSGSYPAFVISSFMPVSTLKGKTSSVSRGTVLRNILVAAQFTISVVLIICTVVVSQQLSYIRNKNLGFSKDHIMVIRIRDKAVREKRDVLREELLKQPGISRVTFSSSLPMKVSSRSSMNYEGAANPQTDKLRTYFASVDYDFIETFQMEIVKGRNFSPQIDIKPFKYIINETAAKTLGWDNPIGKSFGQAGQIGPVVGVVKDFHYANMHLPMEAVAFVLRPDYGSMMSIKIGTENIQETVARIEKVWKTFSAQFPFEFTFMDESYDSMYKSEIRLGTTFSFYSVLAIAICCLGLFGLASFTVEQSRKEIGIRKVLGASVTKIINMLLWRFTKWVIVATGIACPIAYFAMNAWLEDFAYRIDIGWAIFFLAGAIAFFIAFVTVIYQAVRASLEDPIASLHYE
jgi:putative ABC transport system permease protein